MMDLPELNKLVSVSDSGMLQISEISSGESLESLYPHSASSSLKNLIYLSERNCFVVTDQTGKVFVYTVEPIELINKLQCSSTTETWGIQAISNILCVG